MNGLLSSRTPSVHTACAEQGLPHSCLQSPCCNHDDSERAEADACTPVSNYDDSKHAEQDACLQN
eukprot:CAMPEP_0177554742 /NCGR_PEP_ID=MMETSP0369-20130122/68137_1 /TAXON_ID=447022 ORGANISM="Scrippsiella hangoei-like, Strain SHHI-4" /NCGR_SAMPLE_ID=MMETSP0369 /ASSEMBLY_ACC=CAM_ASM_000364 /LENGTH=64 /DNA_ID=CAMNT_0019040769 /DNA_START=16 /DNA_END=207 /DNA_ORIENTATION=-